MITRRFLTAGLVFALLAVYAGVGVSRAASPTRMDNGALIAAILRASDLDERSIEAERRRVEAAVEAIATRVGDGTPDYRRARRLHRVLHRDYLGDYVADADGILEVLDRRSYNCISATLLMSLAARSLGYDPVVLESPGHLFLGLRLRGRLVRIEATSPAGFDTERRNRASGALYVTFGPDGTPRSGYGPGIVRSFSPEEAVGFIWLNAAERAMKRGEALRAARCVRGAARHLPEDVARTESVHALLARAFRTEYEAGRFEDAYRVAAIDVLLFSSSPTSRDRLLAAAYKSIEAACEAGEPAAAEALLDELTGTRVRVTDLRRLERRTCPLIVLASVRRDDWRRARRAAARFALAEPDAREADRLRDWIEERRRRIPQLAPAVSCDAPPLLGLVSMRRTPPGGCLP